MLLLSCPRNGRLRPAWLPLLAAVLLCVSPVGARLPAGAKCPLIDCAKEGRRFCRPGSTHCGPCLYPLRENQQGLCVEKKRPHHEKLEFYPDLDEEIDFIRSFVAKQDGTEIKPTTHQPKHPVSDVKKSRMDSEVKVMSQIRFLAETLEVTTTAPNTPTAQPRATGLKGRVGPIAIPASKNDHVIVIVISLCVAAGAVAVIMATACYIKMQKDKRLAQKVDYPAFKEAGVPPPTTNGPSMGDKNLAQSAQMYHYQHQKQQMLSIGNNKPEQKVPEPEVTSDEEEVGGDFTVYECPGLAPTGEMEVKNPLFDDSNLPNYQGK